MPDDKRLIVGAYVRAKKDREVFVGTIVRVVGEYIVIKHKLKSGQSVEFQAHEDDVIVLPKVRTM